MFDVKPEPAEWPPGRRLALRDLVLVMRKQQIDPACVDIDGRLAKQPERHRGTLEMPAGTSRSRPRIPRRLAWLGRLPQHEIPHVVFGVFVDVHADAGTHAGVIAPRQLAVV